MAAGSFRSATVQPRATVSLRCSETDSAGISAYKDLLALMLPDQSFPDACGVT